MNLRGGAYASEPATEKRRRAHRRGSIRFEAFRPKKIPFAERLTCTIDEACQVTGLGRTKLYELIGAGQLDTTTVGRRRLVVVKSLQALLDVSSSTARGIGKVQ
ncbi:helix-turn-helix domain-containing protein [Bradyrhizobium zhanjiangense]|uniref:helix-turn-helix domain-containing protein n=1 Tax=Bradyrhizobium zhanjiangense TaxID=1325107 RepID=UPI003D311552